MKSKTISDLKQIFQTEEINQETLINLKTDERKGVQKLIKAYENKQRKRERLRINFKAMCYFEKKYYSKGYDFIAGIDEAGRGPLAGPVVAAAVVLPQDFTLLGLTDSKKLNEKDRNYFFEIIKKQALSYSFSIINNRKVDEINIFEATKLAMHTCIDKLSIKPDHVLIDAVELNRLPCTSESIIKGDQKSISIAAASVLAKVTRDNLMKELHEKYPVYKFNSNMGYGTKEHLEAISKYGVSPFHRKTFSPVKKVVNQ